MTILQRIPDSAAVEPDGASTRLSEQEWCEHCALDENTEPGMPVDVVDQSTEQLSLACSDRGVLVEVTFLSCGHTITRPISEQRSAW